MSYPFTRCLTWKEAIDLLSGFGVRLVEREANGLDGIPCRMQYLEHQMDGMTFVHPVDLTNRDERILPSIVRALCADLRISPSIFGLDLG